MPTPSGLRREAQKAGVYEMPLYLLNRGTHNLSTIVEVDVS